MAAMAPMAPMTASEMNLRTLTVGAPRTGAVRTWTRLLLLVFFPLLVLSSAAPTASAQVGKPGTTTVVPDQFLRRWDPVTVFFAAPTGPAAGGPEDAPARYVKLEPAQPGAFTWLDARTLQFRPAEPWPPLAAVTREGRGQELPPGDAAGRADREPAGERRRRPAAARGDRPHLSEPMRRGGAGAGARDRASSAARARRGRHAARCSRQDFEVKSVERASPGDAASYVLRLRQPIPLGRKVFVRFRLRSARRRGRGGERRCGRSRRSHGERAHLRDRRAVPRRALRLPPDAAAGGARAARATPSEQALACEEGDPAIVVEFNSPLESLRRGSGRSPARNFVRISPAVANLAFTLAGKRLEARGEFARETAYRLTLAPAPLRDQSGRTLDLAGTNELTLSFARPAPYLHWAPPRGSSSATGPKMVPVAGPRRRAARPAPAPDRPARPLVLAVPRASSRSRREPAAAGPGRAAAAVHAAPTRDLARRPRAADRRARLARRFGAGRPAAAPRRRAGPRSASISRRISPASPAPGRRAPTSSACAAWLEALATRNAPSAGRAQLDASAGDRPRAHHARGAGADGLRRDLARHRPAARRRGGAVEGSERRGTSRRRLGDALPRHDRRRRPARLGGARGHVRGRPCAARSGGSSSPRRRPAGARPRSRPPTASPTTAGRRPAEPGCSGRRRSSTGAASGRRAWRTSSSSGRSTGPAEPVHIKGVPAHSATRGISRPLTGDGMLVVEGPGDLVWRYPRDRRTTSGSFYWKFDEQDLPTGTYRVHFEFPRQRARTRAAPRASARRPTGCRSFEVRLDAPERAALDRAFDVDLTATYYAGGRVAARPVAWRVTQFPYEWTPKARTGFFFSSDARFSRDRPLRVDAGARAAATRPTRSGSAKLDAQPGGRADRPAAHLRRRGDGGRRRRPDGDRDALGRRPAAVRARPQGAALPRARDRRRTAAPAASWCVGPDDQPIAGQEVTVRLIQRQWHALSARQRLLRRRGPLRHRSGGREGLERQVDERRRRAQAIELELPEAGVYVVELEAHDRLGRAQTVAVDLFAGGGEPVAWAKPASRGLPGHPRQGEATSPATARGWCCRARSRAARRWPWSKRRTATATPGCRCAAARRRSSCRSKATGRRACRCTSC